MPQIVAVYYGSRRVVAPGKIAGWIAPPPRGINGQPFDYEYVRFS